MSLHPIVAQFHVTRRMFAVIGSALKIAPERDTSSHLDWFCREGWVRNFGDPVFEATVRGYVNTTGVYVYRGVDFSSVGVEMPLSIVWEDLISTLSIPSDLDVFFGLVPGRPRSRRARGQLERSATRSRSMASGQSARPAGRAGQGRAAPRID